MALGVHIPACRRESQALMAMQTTNSFSSLVQSLGEFPPDAVVFGKSEAMQALRARMNKVASANVPVLIQGESGTGKDIIARMIHALSPWKGGPWVKVNCPAIPGTLLESELFGYEKGAFTGAYGSKPGRVEMAHRGTLFLDEISELDLSLQSKLCSCCRTDSSAASARRKTRKWKCGWCAPPIASWKMKSKAERSARICTTVSMW